MKNQALLIHVTLLEDNPEVSNKMWPLFHFNHSLFDNFVD